MAESARDKFEDYKRVEKRALDILAQLKEVTNNVVDVELALLVAVFELHKSILSSDAIAGVIESHLVTLREHYRTSP